MIEWNVHDPFGQQAAAGMWDSHIRSVFVFLLSFRRVHDDCTGWVEVTLFIFADGETLKLFLTSCWYKFAAYTVSLRLHQR